MSYTGELKYPTYFSNNETPNIFKFNTIVEAVRYLNNALINHSHSGDILVTEGSIDAMQIGINSIVDLCIITSKIADGNILSIKLYNTSPNEAISTATIRDQAITNIKIQTSINPSTGITASTKIADYNITPIKLDGGVTNPDNQTYYGKDAAGSLGFKTLTIYGTTIGTNGDTIQLKNYSTVLSTLTPNYATNSDTLSGQHESYYTCHGSCSWCCSGDCTATCAESCTGTCVASCSTTCVGGCTGTCLSGCTSACINNCGTTCSGGCTGGCKNSCTGGCDGSCTGGCSGSCYTSCDNQCKNGCTLSCKGGWM